MVILECLQENSVTSVSVECIAPAECYCFLSLFMYSGVDDVEIEAVRKSEDVCAKESDLLQAEFETR